MNISFDKSEVRSALTLDNIFELLQDWGGEPEFTNFGILSATICHNPPGSGSRKLYYYSNSQLFYCYTGCGGSFDIFELFIKISKIQYDKDYTLDDAVRYIAYHFGIYSQNEEEQISVIDKQIFVNYNRIKEIDIHTELPILKEYDPSILSYLNYSLKITPWLQEGITQEVMNQAHIGYYLGGDQITIPHYDINNRFIGLRGRSLVQEDIDRFGKYRPIYVNHQLYNHPLGMNLYNINNSKINISKFQKAIVFESEKSVLKYQSLFGQGSDISVACCGSNLSAQQVRLLRTLGVNEIIVAFDRQFQQKNDDEFKHLVKNLQKIHQRYSPYVTVSFIFDKDCLTSYKAAPIDEGKEKFLKLYNDRIIL